MMGIIYSVKEVEAPRRIPREGCIELPSEPGGEAGAGAVDAGAGKNRFRVGRAR
jgi:hypothetical protein